MFELTDQPIDSAALRTRLERPDAGACVVFEGWVRNHHAGKPVSRLEYEAFDEMARLEGEAITAEAEQESASSRLAFFRVAVRREPGDIVALFRGTVYRTNAPYLKEL